MTPAVDFAGLPELKPKERKLVAAILVLIEEARRFGRSLTKGEIVKSLFFADATHLDRHGRPITFDNYVAMKAGPVGDLAIDMLDGKVAWGRLGLASAPWRTCDHRGLVRYASIDAADRRKLSPSDVEELRCGLRRVLDIGFQGASDESHDHPAWRDAWFGRAAGSRAAAMDWRAFPNVDADLVGDLVGLSRQSA